MALQIPFPYITSLPRDDQEKLRRNFEAVFQQLPAATSSYDAYIDTTIAVDSPSTATFKTVFAAINYVAQTLGKVSMSIGVRPWCGTITETALYPGATASLIVHVELIGPYAGANVESNTAVGVTWAWAGFTDNSKFRVLSVSNLTMSTTSATQFTVLSVSRYMILRGCRVLGVGSANAATGIAPGYFFDSTFNDCIWTQNTFSLYNECAFNFSSNTTSNSWVGDAIFIDCELAAAGTFTLTFTTAGYLLFDGLFAFNSAWHGTGSSGTQTPTVVVSAATTLHWRNRPSTPPGGQQQQMTLSVTSASLKQLVVEGVYDALTTPALNVSNRTPAQVSASVRKADISGPARIDISAGDGAAPVAAGTSFLTLRGTGLSGFFTIRGADSASAGSALNLVSVVRAALVGSINRVGATVGVVYKAYAIDVGSATNVIMLEADVFGLAATNASATTLVFDHTGVPGAPSGAASGSLAGTYPGPTFAGRFASVAELDKDFTKSFLFLA